MMKNEVKMSDTRQALFEYWTKNLANIDSVITNEFNVRERESESLAYIKRINLLIFLLDNC
jgi:hypothetical protein